jgi:hypothetical protein
MPVAKQVYSLTPTWTTVQLADAFRSAFIDAGLMTDWFDSFLSGTIENRILRVVYDDTKTYGITYVWFMFSGATVFINCTTGWNATTHVPQGTVYVDYTNLATNTTSYHFQIFSGSTTVSSSLTRYTSGSSTTKSWFFLRSPTSSFSFTIDKGITLPNFIDLTKSCHTPFVYPRAISNSIYRGISFATPVLPYRRSYLQSMNSYSYANPTASPAEKGYVFLSKNHAPVNFGTSLPYIILPIATTAGNPAYTTDKIPVVTECRISDYTNNQLASDFGLIPFFPNNTMQVQDTIVITAGVEEWEILTVSAGDASNIPSALFAARVI